MDLNHLLTISSDDIKISCVGIALPFGGIAISWYRLGRGLDLLTV
jgi:hypothetical protein